MSDPIARARATHWDTAYLDAPAHSWDQERADRSLAALTDGGVPDHVLDVGGGASPLAGQLLDVGVRQVTVLDVSAAALAEHAARLGARADRVRWVEADVTRWTPEEQVDAWHDRAVFHFLTAAADRQAYRRRLHASVVPGGRVVVATFAPDGPDRCSGLPVARYEGAALSAELGLTDVTFDREVHTTPWGAPQAFTWVIGRRQRSCSAPG